MCSRTAALARMSKRHIRNFRVGRSVGDHSHENPLTAHHVGRCFRPNQTVDDWYTEQVTLSAAKGLV